MFAAIMKAHNIRRTIANEAPTAMSTTPECAHSQQRTKSTAQTAAQRRADESRPHQMPASAHPPTAANSTATDAEANVDRLINRMQINETRGSMQCAGGTAAALSRARTDTFAAAPPLACNGPGVSADSKVAVQANDGVVFAP